MIFSFLQFKNIFWFPLAAVMIQRPLVLSGYAKFIDPELASVGPQQCTKILADPIDNFVGLDLTKPEEHPLHVSEGLDDIVKFLPSCTNTLSDTSGGGSGAGTVVVTWRGIMTKIMTEEPVALLACRYKGVVYLRKNPESELNTNTVPTHPAEIWGRNFEQKIVVSTEEGSKLKEHEFNGIFKTRISGIKIIYGAEIDCTDADGQFVELKTCSIHVKPTHKNSNNNFWQSKAPKYWAQCYLVGIERLLVGFRNNYGILKELQWFQTSDLQKQIPFQKMLKRLEDFLQELLKIVSEEGPLIYWKIGEKSLQFVRSEYENPQLNHIIPNQVK